MATFVAGATTRPEEMIAAELDDNDEPLRPGWRGRRHRRRLRDRQGPRDALRRGGDEGRARGRHADGRRDDVDILHRLGRRERWRGHGGDGGGRDLRRFRRDRHVEARLSSDRNARTAPVPCEQRWNLAQSRRDRRRRDGRRVPSDHGGQFPGRRERRPGLPTGDDRVRERVRHRQYRG